MRQYHPLPALSLAPYRTCMLIEAPPNQVTLDSPAIEVMTDLSEVAAAAIEASASLETANSYMMARGVRSLFVASRDGVVSGLITATDILGERPLRVGQARGVRWSELLVADIMTPLDAVEGVKLEDVRAAKVGHVVASMQQAGRHHMVVIESLPTGDARIRGIFSATQIARQLGIPLQISEVARTFAEVEQTLGAPT